MQAVVGSELVIETADGRSLQGILSVVDPFGNLLMCDVSETSQDKLNSSLKHTRVLGLVSVPRKEVVKILADPGLFALLPD